MSDAIWGCIPYRNDFDTATTERERREAEARRRRFDEGALLPAVDARFCPTCKVNVRKGDGVECGPCVFDGRLTRELRTKGRVFIARSSGQSRTSADRLVAAGIARWVTAAEFIKLEGRSKQAARGSMIVAVSK